MKIIKGRGLILRHIKMSDAEKFFECSRDKEAQRNFMSPPKNINEVRKRVKKYISEYNKKKPNEELFVIEVNGEFVGWIDVHGLNKKYFEHKAELGSGIIKKFRGRGIATKATKLITNYAFKKYKLKRLEGWCRAYNKASARALEKAGFKFEGILRKNKFKNGKYLDDMIWAKVKG